MHVVELPSVIVLQPATSDMPSMTAVKRTVVFMNIPL